jgi:hypothetical protein
MHLHTHTHTHLVHTPGTLRMPGITKFRDRADLPECPAPTVLTDRTAGKGFPESRARAALPVLPDHRDDRAGPVLVDPRARQPGEDVPGLQVGACDAMCTQAVLLWHACVSVCLRIGSCVNVLILHETFGGMWKVCMFVCTCICMYMLICMPVRVCEHTQMRVLRACVYTCACAG